MDKEIQEKLQYIESNSEFFLCTHKGHFAEDSRRYNVCLFETKDYVRGEILSVCENCYRELLSTAARSLNRALFHIRISEGVWLYNTDHAPGSHEYVLGEWARVPWYQGWNYTVEEKYKEIMNLRVRTVRVSKL
jgi:hypothetical protein